MQAEWERMGFSGSRRGGTWTPRRTVSPLRDMRKGNWWLGWIFLRLRRILLPHASVQMGRVTTVHGHGRTRHF